MTTKRPRLTAKQRQLRDDVLGYLGSARIDKVADYIERGRSHAGLSDEAVIEAWTQAFRGITLDPYAPDLRKAEAM
jgi:hypothetical protein